MRCPLCNGHTAVITDGRQSKVGYFRRRKCVECQHTFRTYEIIANSSAIAKQFEQMMEKLNVSKPR